MAENININVSTPNVDISSGSPNVSIATSPVSVSTSATASNVQISIGNQPVVETSTSDLNIDIELTSPQVTVTTLNQAPNGVQQIIPGINTTVSPATGIGIVAVNALGSVSNVSVAAPLSTALFFNLPTNTPQLTIQNATNVLTQFLRADGTWAIPSGSSGSGTVTSITAGVGLGAPATGNSITTSGTINLLAPTATVIGGVKAGTNITIAVDGTISSTGGGGSAGTNWTAPSLIAVGDIVFASSPIAVIPGQTQVFNGTAGGGGVVWTSRVLPSSTTWVRVFFAFNLFIVVSTTGLLITSPDGVTWTQRTLPVTFQWIALAVSATTAVLFGANSGTTLLSSTDAITWTQRTTPVAPWSGVAFGNGIFVAVNTGGFCVTSSDGITWTSRTIANIFTFGAGIVFGNGIFIALSSSTGVIYTSADGITWTNRSLGGSVTGTIVGSVFANNNFVVLLNNTTAVTSPDGITWTTRVLPGTGWTSLAFGNNTFLATTATGVIATSSDAITWELRSLPASAIVGAVYIGFGAGAFVGVGNGPTAYRSPAVNSLFAYPSGTTGLPLACSNGTYRLLGGNQTVTDGLWARTA